MSTVSVGTAIEAIINFLTAHYADSLGNFSSGISGALENFVVLILRVPSWVEVVALTALSLLVRRSIKLALLTGIGLWLIDFMGYWQAMVETLTLVLIATLLSTIVGIPLGIAAARRPGFYHVLQAILDMMQTIPTFVYLIPTLMLFGLGVVPGLISTIIFAIAAPIRATYLGIRSVPSSYKEVGSAFGANSWQSLFKVELPHARPAILMGVTQCLMLSLSMVVIAALVGADGLGKPVLQALNTVNVGKGFEAGLAIVILAIILDRSLIVHAKEQHE